MAACWRLFRAQKNNHIFKGSKKYFFPELKKIIIFSELKKDDHIFLSLNHIRSHAHILSKSKDFIVVLSKAQIAILQNIFHTSKSKILQQCFLQKNNVTIMLSIVQKQIISNIFNSNNIIQHFGKDKSEPCSRIIFSSPVELLPPWAGPTTPDTPSSLTSSHLSP